MSEIKGERHHNRVRELRTVLEIMLKKKRYQESVTRGMLEDLNEINQRLSHGIKEE